MSGPLEVFAEGLEQNAGDWESISELFLNHVRGTSLDDYVIQEIRASADNPDHIVARGVGQGSFTFINTPNFEYSVRVMSPFPGKPHRVKWVGMPQMIAVKGSGTVVVRVLRIPSQLDIEQFACDVQIRDFRVQEVRDGDVLISKGRNEILDIYEITAPTVAQILTYRHAAPSLVWTFAPGLTSLYAEQSSLPVSRFRNVLRLAQEEQVPIPDDIYDLALKSNSPQVALLAIQSMLASGHPAGFAELQRAVESECQSLRKGASELFDALFN